MWVQLFGEPQKFPVLRPRLGSQGVLLNEKIRLEGFAGCVAARRGARPRRRAGSLLTGPPRGPGARPQGRGSALGASRLRSAAGRLSLGQLQGNGAEGPRKRGSWALPQFCRMGRYPR